MRQGTLWAAAAMAGALSLNACGDEPPEPRPMPGSVLAKPAPAISGGTLVKIEGDLFAAADPDTDQIHFVSVNDKSVESIDLALGDEPGRLALGSGKLFAALRGSGKLLAIDLDSRALSELEVCPAPRGLAVSGGLVHVACAGGELVTVDEALGTIVRKLHLERDLRDVIVRSDGKLAVSVFRSAELLIVGPDGLAQERLAASWSSNHLFEPAVAWRTIPLGDQIVMLHQRGVVNGVPIDPEPGAPPESSPYGGSAGMSCGESGILHAGATVFDEYGSLTGGGDGAILGPIVLPVDIALSNAGLFAAIGAGNGVLVAGFWGDLAAPGATLFDCPQFQGVVVSGEPVALTFRGEAQVLVQRRQPAGVALVDLTTRTIVEQIDFGGPSRRDIGHVFFHHAASPSSAISCASCHPEGRDDGRVWHFEGLGARRTQNLAGGVLDTAPLHWDGEFGDLDHLMSEVFVERMGGITPSESQIDALGSWMQTIPTLPSSHHADPAAVERGRLLYSDATVGCASCHGGQKLTNHQTMDVGTGSAFQVPSLVGIADRAPFMHDGCAPTLLDRFEPSCGGGDLHGVTSHLSASELDDLVAYLETL